MQDLFLKVANMSITASYVILVILFFRILLKRAPKKYSYLLWSVALFRLVCPISYASVFSIFHMAPFDMSIASQENMNRLSYIPANIGYMSEPKISVGIPAANSFISGSLPKVTTLTSINPMQIWIFIGTLLWCIGMMWIVLYSFFRVLNLRRRMTTAVLIKRNIYASDNIPAPFILGIFRPIIYIPFGLKRSERTYILRHEFYHLQRKDHLIKLLSFLVLTIHWFNPLVWVAYVCMTNDMEMSCDEKVLIQRANISKQYSLSLLSFATNKKYIISGPLAFGERGIKERIKNVLRMKQYPKGVIIFVVGLCSSIMIACAANPQINVNSGDMNELYGSYAFEEALYINPISSFLYIGIKEYYTFNEESFYLINSYNMEELNVTYEKAEVTEKEFKSSFDIDIGVPSISSYKVRNQYTLKSYNTSTYYRLYEMDEELWLAKINKGIRKEEEKEIIWSIVKISKIKEEAPKVVNLSETNNNTEEFEKILDEKQYNLIEGDTCFNITSQAILLKSNMTYEVYKYNKSGASFLLYNNQIYPLGIWFGALGVTSMEVADLNEDGLEEFYFTNSWGSGLHRSNVGYFDPALKEVITFDYSYENDELLLYKNEDGKLLLYAAKVDELNDFAHFKLSRIAYVTELVYKNNQIFLDFKVRD